ncbi:glycosyltransferase family 4 protein [Nitrospira lenta]|uniref:Alpha-D-QuiNAc alpha-1,3-galactosyltransferase n=1 Tax=Nitrospira lenta TaxID=1436998 RepID=A0A330L6V1_9BACT|nr:glycosyltransferase family 4 protein [Nitrospira lenta]SPP65627.1 Alpha-D-QuiNAc alpha-1,3-galactosyltransferase [Nitrospira lenta]
MRPRLLFLITEDWTFWEIRRDLARLAREAGYDVTVATRVTAHAERIRQEGFELIPIMMLREGRNPFRELRTLFELVRIYRRVRPQIVQHVAMKPVLYGSLAAWVARIPVVINVFGGLGYAFTDRPQDTSVLRSILQRGLRWAIALSRSVVVVQNQDDRDVLIQEHIVDPSRIRLIAGSGVDLHRFVPVEPPSGDPIVMLVGRMLWDKGVGEFVEAVAQLKKQGVCARFVLVGRCDQGNPTAIPEAQLQRWIREYGVEWWGHREDLPTVFGQATLVVLPSYREGLPKVLLEAAACGKAVIATDVPGCRSVVHHQQTGLLVPVHDAAALAEAIAGLVGNAEQRMILGEAARQFVMREHSSKKISAAFLSLYRELLGPSAPAPAMIQDAWP